MKVSCHTLALIGLIAPLVVTGGCARFEYAVVEPPDLAQHIGTKSPVVLPMEPIQYEAITRSGRLVLFIHNQSDQPIKLLGEDSFAVDPRGESHPLPTRTIAPGTSSRLVLPPVRPTFRRSGPSFGLGVGVGLSRGYGRRGYYGAGGFAGDPFYYDRHPRYYRLEDDGTIYWDWKGNGTVVRLRLVYQDGERRFHHDLAFRRVRV